MLKILYFASLRETLGRSTEDFDLPSNVSDVGGLLRLLQARGGVWATLGGMKNLRYAVNQEMANLENTLQAGDEVAFFPPVTGG